MQETKSQLNEIPMSKEMRIMFLQRLKDIRNTVVADVKLTNEEKLMVKGQSAKPEDEKSTVNEN